MCTVHLSTIFFTAATLLLGILLLHCYQTLYVAPPLCCCLAGLFHHLQRSHTSLNATTRLTTALPCRQYRLRSDPRSRCSATGHCQTCNIARRATLPDVQHCQTCNIARPEYVCVCVSPDEFSLLTPRVIRYSPRDLRVACVLASHHVNILRKGFFTPTVNKFFAWHRLAGAVRPRLADAAPRGTARYHRTLNSTAYSTAPHHTTASGITRYLPLGITRYRTTARSITQHHTASHGITQHHTGHYPGVLVSYEGCRGGTNIPEPGGA